MNSNLLFRGLFLLFFSLYFFTGDAQTYQWAVSGASEGYDYGNGIVSDDSGNVYIGGQIEYSAQFTGVTLNTNGKHDIMVGKFNTNGAIKWLKHAGGIGGDLAWGVGIDKFHNVIISGEFEYTAGFDPGDSLTVAGSNDIFIAKYGPNGDVLWLRRMGSSGDDKAKAIAVDANGSIYVTGYFSNNSTFGSFTVNSSGGNDFFITKYSSSGTCQWVKKAGGSQEDRGRGIVIDPFGNLYVAGTFTNSINFNGTNYTGPNTNNAFIAKYDTLGNFIWAKTAGACCDTSRYNGITCDASGNAYVIGYFKASMTVGSTTLNTKGNSDVVIAKYSPSGNVLWARDEGGDREDMGYHLNFDNRKNLLYVTGFYDYQSDFDTIHLNSAGNRDAFLAAYDPNGHVQWARTAGGNERDCGQAVDFDTLGNVYETGFFNSYADFDAAHVTGDTLADFFLAKISPALAPQPANASSSLSASLINCDKIQLNWTSGNGSNRIVIVRSDQSQNVFPADGNSYSANAEFGSGANLGNGNFVVYNGTGNSALITGLPAGTEYVFTVIEFNGNNNTSNYFTSSFASTTYMVNGFAMNLTSSANTICSGNNATLSVTGGVSYQWSPAYAISSTTGASVIVSPDIATTYTVEGTNIDGCHSIEEVTVYVNPSPAVQYDNVFEVCQNSSPVTLSGGNPSGGSYSGTGVSGGSFFPNTNPGLHIISYTYTDIYGCASTDTSSVFVDALPVITMPVFPVVCNNGQPVTLSGALPSGGIYTGSSVTAGVFDPTVNGPGTSNIIYTYTDNHGCINSGSANITVSTLPVVTMSSFQGVCQNSAPMVLTGGMPAGGIYNGTGVSSNIFSPSVAGSGFHIITYIYTDNNNCTNSASTIMTVKSLPSVSFTTLAPACVNGAPFNLSGGTPAGGAYSGTGVTNNSFDPIASGQGNFLLTYTYQDLNGCTNTAQQMLTVNSLPSVSLVVPSDVCDNGSPVTLNLGNPAGGTYSGQNVSNGIFNPQNVPAGPYAITYSYTDNHNCTGAATKTINVRNAPNVFIGNDTVVCAGSILQLNAGAGFSTYHWSNGASSQTIQLNSNTAASINCVVTVTNSYSCSASDTIHVTFDVCNGIASINSDYPWCYIYPNPFTNNFTLFTVKKMLLKIYDVSGRLIEEHECEGSFVTGENLSPGIYFIDAIYNNQSRTYKVVKAE